MRLAPLMRRCAPSLAAVQLIVSTQGIGATIAELGLTSSQGVWYSALTGEAKLWGICKQCMTVSRDAVTEQFRPDRHRS